MNKGNNGTFVLCPLICGKLTEVLLGDKGIPTCVDAMWAKGHPDYGLREISGNEE